MTLPTSIIARPRVDLPHHRIHEGRYFSVSTIATGLPAGVPKDFMIISPPAFISFAHVIVIIDVNPGATFQLFEDAEVSTNGIPLKSYNSVRSNPTAATGFAFENPTVVFTGTQLFIERIGSSTVGGTGGPADRDEEEIIFKPLTNYLLRTTPFPENLIPTTLSIEMRAYRQATQAGT